MARRVVKRYLDVRRPSATNGWLCGAGFGGRRDIASCYSPSRRATVIGSRAR
jgi:hypothetical protein